MEKVPPEIFSKIIDNLDAPLASYSTVSRDWQCHIETRTMVEVHVRSNDANKLDTVFQDPRRRALLKTLKYEIILPAYNPLRWSKVPGRRECLKNNIVFTRELRDLFGKLHAYDQVNGATPFRLEFDVSCPMDTYEYPPSQGTTDGTGPNRNKNAYIYLEPVEQEPLPVLIKVVGFISQSHRHLHSDILGLVLRSLPAVESISWSFTGPDVRLLDLRRDLRTSLAHILSSTSLASLRDLHLYWEDTSCHNHSFHAESLLNPETGLDDLSVALRKIAQLPTIKSLKLKGLFLLSSEFFPSTELDDDSLSISWPSLETLDIQLSSMTPAGGWYFTGDPDLADRSQERGTPSDSEGVDSSDSELMDDPPTRHWAIINGERPYNVWRRQPSGTYDSFILEIAKSVPQMLALRRLTCQMGNQMDELQIDVEFLTANEKSFRETHSYPREVHATYSWPHWEVVLTSYSDNDNEDTIWEVPEELIQAWKLTTGSQVDSIHIVNGGQRFEL